MNDIQYIYKKKFVLILEIHKDDCLTFYIWTFSSVIQKKEFPSFDIWPDVETQTLVPPFATTQTSTGLEKGLNHIIL